MKIAAFLLQGAFLMATIPKITLSWISRSILEAYERKNEIWLDLEDRIRQAAQQCGTFEKEQARVIFYALRTSVREARAFEAECTAFRQRYDVKRLKPINAVDILSIQIYLSMEEQTQKYLEKLAKEVSALARGSLIPLWESAKDRLERRLTQEGVKLSPVQWVQSYVPTSFGGTWPRVNIYLNDYKPIQEHPTQGLLNRFIEQTDPTPPTFAEETAELRAVIAKLENLLKIEPEPLPRDPFAED